MAVLNLEISTKVRILSLSEKTWAILSQNFVLKFKFLGIKTSHQKKVKLTKKFSNRPWLTYVVSSCRFYQKFLYKYENSLHSGCHKTALKVILENFPGQFSQGGDKLIFPTFLSTITQKCFKHYISHIQRTLLKIIYPEFKKGRVSFRR